jgi:hypothetical protein
MDLAWERWNPAAWVRRRHIELADLVNELWIFPPKGNRLELLARDVFGAKGSALPTGFRHRL